MTRIIATLILAAGLALGSAAALAGEGQPLPGTPAETAIPEVPVPLVPVTPAVPAVPAPAPTTSAPAAPVPVLTPAADAAYEADLHAKLCAARPIFCELDASGHHLTR